MYKRASCYYQRLGAVAVRVMSGYSIMMRATGNIITAVFGRIHAWRLQLYALLSNSWIYYTTSVSYLAICSTSLTICETIWVVVSGKLPAPKDRACSRDAYLVWEYSDVLVKRLWRADVVAYARFPRRARRQLGLLKDERQQREERMPVNSNSVTSRRHVVLWRNRPHRHGTSLIELYTRR